MNKLKSLILGALAVAGACVVQADSISYLDPVFDSTGAVVRYDSKSVSCTAYSGSHDSTTLNDGWYVMKGPVSFQPTLTINGDVKIILENGATLKVNEKKSSRGGLRVESGSSLTIYAQSEGGGWGALYAYGGSHAAGIGSGSAESAKCGTITINGGYIRAEGGHDGAGIGGGDKGTAGEGIIINGGDVKATGGDYGPGIGGGCYADGKNITINGGTVTATGGADSSGIGGGGYKVNWGGWGKNITVNGGTVTATGGSHAAGIGGACTGGGSDITINGGTVNATGGNDGAGIGCGLGHHAHSKNITINGGTVNATGGDEGAGIGGGCYCEDITINGGTVTATGGSHAPGVGDSCGYDLDRGNTQHCATFTTYVKNITINGGTVNATGGSGGAGIGSAWRSHAENITINGGTVTATGGKEGAGIGGGSACRVSNIVITGGRVTATGGDDGPGIGGGSWNFYVFPEDAGRLENLTISGGTICAKAGSSAACAIGHGNPGTQISKYETSKNFVFTGGSITTLGEKGIEITPTNGSGAEVKKTTVTGVEESPAQIGGLGSYGVNDLYPDNGNLYLWLASGNYSFHSQTKLYSGNAGSEIGPSGTYSGIIVNDDPVTDGGGSGKGWSYANDVLSLSEAKAYTLTGTDATGKLCVDVHAKATVTFDNLTLNPSGHNCIAFSSGSSGSELVLSGDNTVYSRHQNCAAVVVRDNVSVTLSGSGTLTGGKSAGANSRGVNINSGSSLTMTGGTITGFKHNENGAGVYNDGTFTMNGGTISGCQSSSNGGGLCNNGTFTMNGGTISGCIGVYGGGITFYSGTGALNAGTISGCNGTYGGGFAVIGEWGTADVKVDVHDGMVIKDNSNVGHSPVFLQGGTINVWGGTFTGNSSSQGYGVLTRWSGNFNVYGGVITGNSINPVYQCSVYGLVSDRSPNGIVSGSAAAKVGRNYVVGKNMAAKDGKLLAGTYTFNPTNDECVAASVAVADGSTVTAQGTTPVETYVVANPAVGFLVNGAPLDSTAPDRGWTYDAAASRLTLTEEKDYTLTGIAAAALRVEVTANAKVTLDGLALEHSGSESAITFKSAATDAELVLVGTNDVHSVAGHAAVCVESGTKVTLSGDGEFVGTRATGSSSRCINVASGGTFVMLSGTIRDYHPAGDGGAVYNEGTLSIRGGMIAHNWAANGGAVYNKGSAAIYGGTVKDNVSDYYAGCWYDYDSCHTYFYGGYFSGNSSGQGWCHFYTGWNYQQNGRLYGGVFDADPVDSGQTPNHCLILKGGAAVTQVGRNYVVGKDVTQANNQLTGGTYTFNPTNAEYAAAGVKVASDRPVVELTTDPVTYVIDDPAKFHVNGVLLDVGSGEGWTYDKTTGILTLDRERDYGLSGSPDSGLQVYVTTNANVTLASVTLTSVKETELVVFSSGATNATLTLDGENKVYSKSNAISIESGAKVTVREVATGGSLVGSGDPETGGRCIQNNGTLILESGMIRNYAIYNPYQSFGLHGGCICNAGAFTMDGGTISGCKATGVSFGGAVYSRGTVTVNGGSICGNSADDGGAIYNAGTAVVRGGTFEDNKADNHGGCFYSEEDCSVTIYGGTYSGNTAKGYAGTGSSFFYGCVRSSWAEKPGCLSGGVFATDPMKGTQSSGLELVGDVKVTEVGYNKVVGKDVKSKNNELTGGTYTFNPEDPEYAAKGLAVMGNCSVTAHPETTPETYVVTRDPEFRINKRPLSQGSGTGWNFNKGVLTLDQAMDYALSGNGTTEIREVKVTASAHVALTDVKIVIGALGHEVFNVSGSDVRFSLGGTNEIYTTDGHAAIGVAANAKLTIDGDGALVGGKASPNDGRCVTVAAKGELVMNSGTIRDYYTAAKGAAVYNSGTTSIFGGLFTGNDSDSGVLAGNSGSLNVYGGVFSGNSVKPADQCAVSGGVYDVSPDGVVGGSAATQVGANYVVGKDLAQKDGALTGGTYTFDPTRDEYAAAGVAVARNCLVKAQGTTPETYAVVQEAEFKVNGVQLMDGPGEGWTFDVDAKRLTLVAPTNFTLTGYSDLTGQIDVLSNATVTLSGISIHAGQVGHTIFNVSAEDATFVLKGTNEVYASDGSAAICVGAGAKLTVTGDGELVGGRARSANGRGFAVYGTLVVDGGTIRDYYTTGNGGAVYNGGTTVVYGGTFTNNAAGGFGGCFDCEKNCSVTIYGGTYSGNTAPGKSKFYNGRSYQKNGFLYGGVFAADPTSDEESEYCLVAQDGAAVTQIGENYIVGKDVTEEDGALTGGTYTFNPTDDLYVDAGVEISPYCLARTQGTTPETYVIVQLGAITVNGTKLLEGPGVGWSFDPATDRLTLDKPIDYTLKGFADLPLTVDVLSNATVTLDGIDIRAGNLGREIFRVSAADATFVLKGTNEVFATDGNAAIGIANGAMLTVEGDGILVGGKAHGANGRGFYVSGSLVIDGGTIRDYYTTSDGGAVYNSGTFTMNGGMISGNKAANGGVLYNSGTASVYGGTIKDNVGTERAGFCYDDNGCHTSIYGGYFSGNKGSDWAYCNLYTGYGRQHNGYLYGGVFAADPMSKAESGDGNSGSCLVLQNGAAVTQVGSNYIVGKDVTQENGALTGGTYTFNPKDAEYAAAGVTLDPVCKVRSEGTDPETYVVYKEAEFKVNGVRVRDGSGTDWTFDEATKRLTLAAPTNFTLTGYSDLAGQIDVLSNATVTLDGIAIRAGANGRSIVTVFSEDATFVLKGTSEVYTTDGNAAVFVTAGAKLTVAGDGELVGGRTAGANGRGFTVYGTLVVESGTIRDYYTTDKGGAVYNSGTTVVYGGTFTDNAAGGFGGCFDCEKNCRVTIYGGIYAGNTAPGKSKFYNGRSYQKNGSLYGGVFAADPTSDEESEYCLVAQDGAAAEQVGDLYIVGKDVSAKNDQLTGGTYTFNPTDDLYVDAGVAVAAEHIILAQATDPVTYVVDWNWTDFLVDGTDLVIGSGDGWSYDFETGLLTLDAAKTYVLSGALTRKDLDLGVTVDAAGATVVLSNATITSSACSPIAANASGVTVELVGRNRLEACGALGDRPLPVGGGAAIAVADGASVMIARGTAAGETANLDAVGGANAVAIGGEGDVTIVSGTVSARGGIVGANVTISGGTVSATGRDGAADVDGTDVRITGGSVVASKVTDPKNADGDAVWCVTVPDVVSRGPVAITNVAHLTGVYGQTDLYPVGGSLSLWLPNGTYNGFYVGDDPIPYYAVVAGEPTVAIRKILALYVNGELVTAPEHAGGWTYVDGVLMLDATTDFVITGESTAGDVRIVVNGDEVYGCNVTLSGVRLGMGDKTLEDNLLWIEMGIVNLTIDGATAFQVNGDKKPIGVNEYATLNIRGSGTAFAWGVDVVEGGRVTMEDPTSVTFTTQEAAEAAAAVVKPVADENDFPDIDQEAYAERFVVSAVQSGPGTWTLDYQINEATSNELQAAISSVETLTNLVEAIVGGTPTVTITPIPGFYYGMAGTTEVTEMESDAARPPAWYVGQQDEELEVSGTTFQDAVKAFYQLKATAKP